MAQRTLSRAVVERRAPGEVESDDALTAKWRALDWFATPPWGSRAGAELIKRIDPLADSVWEPACGDGIMAECLKEYFSIVLASDISPQGYGAALDFLADDTPIGGADWIVTNPPFKHAAKFVSAGLRRAHRGVAVLCRSVFLESAERYEMLFKSEWPLSVFAPFCERLPMSLGPWEPSTSSATAYAWFLFCKDKPAVEGTRFAPRIHPIAPGTRARLTRENDIRRFVMAKSAPLLEGAAA